MRFCDTCGSYLKETREGLWCPRCKKVLYLDQVLKPKSVEKKKAAAIHVISKPNIDHVEVSRTCPECGNGIAQRWVSTISGEHAGVRRERIVEHFRCTKCSHSWSESS